jgi:hypothetical protein
MKPLFAILLSLVLPFCGLAAAESSPAEMISNFRLKHGKGHVTMDGALILVIEVKKSTNAIPDDADLLNLEQIKRQIGYRYALFVRLSAGPDAELAKVRTVWL